MLQYDPIIYDKLARYCAYRERCVSEVRDKMRSLGVIASLYDAYLSELQEEGYQNEERYAMAFAQGRMRMKGWGLRKIELHLKQKGVPAQIITAALEHDEDYAGRLRELAIHKFSSTKGKSDYERRSKVFRYLQQRGYETELIHKLLFESDAIPTEE